MSKPMDMKRTSEWVNEECPGEDCPGCGSSECYAMGGKVSLKQQLEDADDNTNSTPIYSTQSSASGQPQAGYGHGWNKNSDNSYSMDDYADPKTWRKNRVANAYAQGGSITSHRGSETGHEKGINKRHDPYIGNGGGSQAGYDARGAKKNARPDESKRSVSNQVSKDYRDDAKEHHKQTLGEMKSMKKPNLYAEGGEVEMGDDEMATALSDAACGELLESIEKKDKAGILEAIRALVLSVR